MLRPVLYNAVRSDTRIMFQWHGSITERRRVLHALVKNLSNSVWTFPNFRLKCQYALAKQTRTVLERLVHSWPEPSTERSRSAGH